MTSNGKTTKTQILVILNSKCDTDDDVDLVGRLITLEERCDVDVKRRQHRHTKIRWAGGHQYKEMVRGAIPS